MVGDNTRITPLGTIEIDFQHVIGHDLTKTKLLIGNLGLRGLSALDTNRSLLYVNSLKQELHKQRKLW